MEVETDGTIAPAEGYTSGRRSSGRALQVVAGGDTADHGPSARDNSADSGAAKINIEEVTSRPVPPMPSSTMTLRP